MSLANGRAYLAIPGPSVIPDAVLRAMHQSSPNIYEGALVEMTYGLIPDLRHVAQTDHDVAIYIGNGHAAWEAALSNVLAPGDTVLVAATGRFGHGWSEIARGIGAVPQVLDFGTASALDPDRIEAALRADTHHEIRAVLVTHVDTATSVRNDLAPVRAAMDAAGHPALLMADCIASLGCDRFEMDASGVDVTVAASQKGLMTPPGLAFVWMNGRAHEARDRLERVSGYWDWRPRVNPQYYYQLFFGTAPTHHLFGLRAALDMIRAEGLPAIWDRHATLARAIWAACAAWGAGGDLRMNISDPALRSHAVTALALNAPDATRLRRWCETQAGLTLGIGLGMSTPGDPAGDGFFRLGHMGHVNAQMIMGMLGTVEAGFTALDIPHGSGALSAAAAVLAEATRP